MKIPTPFFVVFYNGVKEQEDYIEYRLSDSFANKVTEPELELKVRVLNVNEGHCAELMDSCKTLKQYSIYVGKVRKYMKSMDLKEAVERSVRECIEDGVLGEILRKNRSEVVATSIFEYNKEEEERKLREAEFEYGRKEGEKSGIEAGINALISSLKELDIPREVIIEKLMDKFSLTKEEADVRLR